MLLPVLSSQVVQPSGCDMFVVSADCSTHCCLIYLIAVGVIVVAAELVDVGGGAGIQCQACTAGVTAVTAAGDRA
jgi:hypothetical protein